jgi:hypothetical protein
MHVSLPPFNLATTVRWSEEGRGGSWNVLKGVEHGAKKKHTTAGIRQWSPT